MRPIALLVITDGREEYLNLALTSAADNLDPHLLETKILVDDSGMPPVRDLDADWQTVYHSERRGFVSAINSGWAAAAASGAEFVFHLEGDFIFNESVDLMAMMATLDAHPELAHLVLRRQPWNSTEIAQGSMGGLGPGDTYTVQTDRVEDRNGDPHNVIWTEHEQFYSTNPALVPRHTFERQFPAGSEVGFAADLRVEAQRVAFWGGPQEAPRVTHIGRRRAEGWKL